MTDLRALLVGSPDYKTWRAAYIRAVMGTGPVPPNPDVWPLWELLAEARDTRGTQAISSERTGTRPTPGSVVLADLTRLETLGANTLTTWVRLCAEERAAQGITDMWPDDTDEAQSVWLASRIDWAEAQPWAEQFRLDIRSLHGQLRAICRVRPEYVPRCRKCSDVVVPRDGDGRSAAWHEAGFGQCLGCGWTYPKGPALDALGQLQEFTIPELSERVGVPERTLRDWAERAIIKPVGKAGKARTYQLDHVMQVKDRMGRRAG